MLRGSAIHPRSQGWGSREGTMKSLVSEPATRLDGKVSNVESSRHSFVSHPPKGTAMRSALAVAVVWGTLLAPLHAADPVPKVFLKSAPESIQELKEIQDHVQKLAKKMM